MPKLRRKREETIPLSSIATLKDEDATDGEQSSFSFSIVPIKE
jgi:hypothetical protein